MALDPVVPLASTMHASPGTVALLLGSGISRAASIPTGWEVVNDLARKVAKMTDGSDPADPIAWLTEHTGAAVDYSSLLAELAQTPADRRDLLNGYFEPTEEEREHGAKLPTRAHHAIAALVSRGYVSVIVTPNFDRLLEAALRLAGVEPVVISTAAAAAGAAPIAHTKCTIIKVHGDYLDLDLRNTVDELDHYDPAIDKLLDTVFADYGLVTCGWSADWDSALRQAILRAPSRRYGVWWTHTSQLSAMAADVAAHRDAVRIQIASADEFFDTLNAKVGALEDLADQRPLSTALAVAELKRYMPRPEFRIRLQDLVGDEITAATSRPVVTDAQHQSPTYGTVSAEMCNIETAAATLIALASTLSYYADEPAHDRLVHDLLRRLATIPRGSTRDATTENLRLYPALLSLYAIAMTSETRERIAPVIDAVLTVETVSQDDLKKYSMIIDVAPWRVLASEVCNFVLGAQSMTATSDYMHRAMREPLRPLIPDDNDYSRIFDRVEYLFGLLAVAIRNRAPVGRFAWRLRHLDVGIDSVLLPERTRADLIGSRLFDSEAMLQAAIDEYAKDISRMRFW